MMVKIPHDKVSYQFTLKVVQDDIDSLGHVNNVNYLKWTQQVASMHWKELSSDALRKKVMWFVLRHEIDYLQQAFINDTLAVYTWIEDVKGARSNRMFRIYRGDELLAKCKTTWCLIDTKTQKPMRIDDEIMGLFVLND